MSATAPAPPDRILDIAYAFRRARLLAVAVELGIFTVLGAAGTLHAAAYFGQESAFGRVAPGHAADLVLTERNPLEEPGTLRAPRAVMQEGRLYRREALQRMTTDAQSTAGSWRYTVHFLRDFLRNPGGFAN